MTSLFNRILYRLYNIHLLNRFWNTCDFWKEEEALNSKISLKINGDVCFDFLTLTGKFLYATVQNLPKGFTTAPVSFLLNSIEYM